MANGRCYRHGGRTPRGDDWHKPKWPKGTAADAERKLAGKLKHLAKRARSKAARLDKMLPEQREQHRRWQSTHSPGPAIAREAKRARRRKDTQAEALLSLELEPTTESEPRLTEAIAALERQRERLAGSEEFDIFG